MIGLPVGDTATRCDDTTSSRRNTALALTIPGLLLMVVGGGIAMNAPITQGARVGNA